MNGWEIACVIVGIIFLLGRFSRPNTKEALLPVLIQNIILMIVSGCLILLPLYFNYWRR